MTDRLVHKRVTDDPGAVFRRALEEELTGRAVLEPVDALLLDGDGHGVIDLVDGVPRAARHTGTNRTGSSAIADLAVPGPYRVELHERDDSRVARDAEIPSGMVAETLFGDDALAEATREVAPGDTDVAASAIETFLEDDAKIEAIKEQARAEAVERAEEWGLTTELE